MNAEEKKNKKTRIIKTVYFAICAVLNVIFAGIMVMTLIYGTKYEGNLWEEIGMIIPFIIIPVWAMIIDIAAIVKLKKITKLIRTAFFMKATVFCALVSIMYFSPAVADANEAGFMFLLLAVMFLALAIAFGLRFRDENNKPIVLSNIKKYEAPKFTAYKSKWVYDDAYKEYLAIRKYPVGTEISDEENEKIYEYASMPFLYLLTWLIDNDLMSASFYDYGLSDEDINELKERMVNPSLIFSSMDYVCTREDIAEGSAIEFVDYYFEDRNLPYDAKCEYFVFDYYKLIRNDDMIFYCHDFSWDIYDRLAEIINSRYMEFTKKKTGIYYAGMSEEDMNSMENLVNKGNAVWTVTDTKLEVTAEPDINPEYLKLCLDSMNNLPEEEIKKIVRMLDANWCLMDSYELDKIDFDKEISFEEYVLNQLCLDEVVVFNERYGMTNFILCGEPDFEEEHGIAISVVNNIVTSVGYRGDYEFPWNETSRRLYEMLNTGIDISKVNSMQEVLWAEKEGLLVKRYMHPLSIGGEEDDSNICYVTPFAAKQVDEISERLEAMDITGMYTDLKVSATYHYGDKENYPVPVSVYYRAEHNGKTTFSGYVRVWE